MKVKKVTDWVIGILATVLLTVGVLILYAGVETYLGREPTSEGTTPFATVLIGMAVVSFPLAVYFSIKASRQFRSKTSRYDLPESPFRLFLLLVASGGFVLLMVLSLVLYLICVSTS
ncbi:MAG: hypothetical protein QHI48_09875 [Bacteroidota bacterium]|nr:hypothetical protein [Bacteroidota bacterium]